MIALAPFLCRRPVVRTIDPENQALTILLDGIARSALPSGAKEMREFRDSMADLCDELEPETGPNRAALIAEDVARLLAEHNRAERDYVFAREQELTEMRGVVEVLANGLKQSGYARTETLGIVSEVLAISTENIPQPGALAALRLKLSESLRRSLAAAPSMDNSAETALRIALRDSWENRENMCAVLFSIERMASINARFGYKAGDQLLSGLSQHLATNLPAGDKLFRWRGPHLMALIQRDLVAGLHRLEMALIGAWCTEYEIKVRDRQALIPVSVVWEMFPLKDFTGVEELIAAFGAWCAMLNSKGWSS